MSQKLNNNLSNNTVLIIGGSYGIGRDIADALASAQAKVVVLSRTPPKDNFGITNSLLSWQQLDLSDPNKSRARLEEILSKQDSKLDAIFYSAVYYGPKHVSFLATSEADWRQQLNINLYGLWLSLLLTFPILKQHTPSLFIHLSSDVIYNAGPWRAGYAATKAAASNLINSLAQEQSEGHVRLIQLIPGRMVDIGGICDRRSSSFVYKDDMLTKHLQQAALQLLQTRGAGMHGKTLVLDKHGKLLCLDETISNS